MFRWNQAVAVGLAVVGILGVRPAAQAGGLVQHLPPDGSWVALSIESEQDFGGNLQSSTREVKIASVGSEKVDGQPARWIEMSTEFGGRKMLAKMLIAEKFLTADQDSFSHVAKAWALGRDGKVVELPKERLRGILVFGAGVPHFEKLAKKGKEAVTTELGEFQCERAAGQAEQDGPQGSKAKFDGELWTNEKVPFGLVKAKIKLDLGKINFANELTAVRSGSGAKSELPDAK